MKRLREVETPLANFFASGVLGLGQTLGPLLGQLPASFPHDPQVLDDFCRLLPRTTTEAQALAARHGEQVSGDELWSGDVVDRPLRHALEPRHASFGEPEVVAHLESRPVVDVRLHGATELCASGYTDEALDSWARRLVRWTADGRDAYVYFDNDAKGFAPHDARRLATRLAWNATGQ